MVKKDFSLSFEDLMIWREAFATCAIEGNKTAQYMLTLEKTDSQKYLIELIGIIERGERQIKCFGIDDKE